jgi:uncharacterized membrane protein
VRARLAIALVLAPVAALAAEVREIPEQGGVRMTWVSDISGDGAVLLGTCRTASADQLPCRFSEASGYQLLQIDFGGSGYAAASSLDGSVSVGWMDVSPGDYLPVRWHADGSWTPIAAEIAIGEAMDVSGDGSVVVGWGGNAASEYGPFRWSAQQGVTWLYEASVVNSVSADGRTAGGCCIHRGRAHWPSRPFLWRDTGELVAMAKVHPLPEHSFAISPDGRFVLASPDLSSAAPGFALRWSVERGPELLARPSPGGFHELTVPFASSYDASVIVGASTETGSFVWDAEHGARTLRTVLEAAGADVSAWETFDGLRAISHDGRKIPALGVRPSGDSVVVLAILDAPEAEESSAGWVLLLVLAPLALRAGRRALPLALAIAAWPTAVAAADLVKIEPATQVELAEAWELSGDGRVVTGMCRQFNRTRPCRWTVGVGPALFAEVSGNVAITHSSYDGSVAVGYASSAGASRALLWNAAGIVETLPVPEGGGSVRPVALSSDGSRVILRVRNGFALSHFRWTRATGLESIVPPPGFEIRGFAADADVAFGPWGDSDNAVWREGEAPVPLPYPREFPFYAAAASADGAVVVGTESIQPSNHVLRWTETSGTEVLEPVGWPFFLQPMTHDVSADGATVIGVDDVAGAWLWRDGPGLMRLGDHLARLRVPNAAAWEFTDVRDVSDDGRFVLAGGYEGDDYRAHVVVNVDPACDDGVDNDGDGSVDGADASCTSPLRNTERACGLGSELAFVIAPLAVARARRRATRTRP